jgi:threonylcarbamoyladenosine tRNA methylthiotransferase MtaB
VPGVGLGADVIVGFPGETETMFRETFEFIESSPLNYLHVFSWSPRPGTPAADLPDRVASTETRERSARLRRLGDRIGFRFRKLFEGQRLDAIALGARPGDGRVRALTGNFIEVSLDPGSAERGEPVEVGIERVTPGESRARRLGRPLWAAHDAPIR